MEITEVRVKLVDGGQDKLRAFCSITIDDAFVVRDLKVIEGTKGLFVAMPSRKLTSRCQRCGFKNQVRSNYCNECGTTLPPESSLRLDGKGKLHADIAHPINTECRERLQARVVESYLDEIDASKQPGYRPRDLDDADEEYSAESAAEGPRGEGNGERPPPRAPERLPERLPERRAERPRDRSSERGAERAAELASDRSPLLADRTFADRSFVERTPIERTVSDRSPVEQGPSVRGPSEARVPDRRSPERPALDRFAAESPRPPVDDEAPRPSPERRPTGRGRGPLAEMPPPDDNFSAGIF